MRDFFDLDWKYCKAEDIWDLFDKNVYNNTADEMGLTPLMYTVQENRIIGDKTEEQDDIFIRPIQYDLSVLEAMLRTGADVTLVDKNNMTSLMYASMYNHSPEAIDMLVKFGSDVNAKDNLGRTALLLACQYNTADIVETLIKNGANIYEQDNRGRNAIWYAVHHKLDAGNDVLYKILGDKFCSECDAVFDVLEKFHGDLKAVDEDGRTALLVLLSIKTGIVYDPTPMSEVVDKFKAFGADVDVIDNYGCSIVTYMMQEEPFSAQNNTFDLQEIDSEFFPQEKQNTGEIIYFP